MNPPPIPPHSDISGIGHLQKLPSTPERTHINHLVKTPVRRDLPPIPVANKSYQPNSDVISEVEVKEDMRELEEVRARVAQMEKTMRWWSDCTANWREKWSKVRNERNHAREENRSMKLKLDSIQNENNDLKNYIHEIEIKYKRSSNNEVKIENRSVQSEPSLEEVELRLSEEKENLQKGHTIEHCNNVLRLAFEETKEKLNKEIKEKLNVSEAMSRLQGIHDKLQEKFEEVVRMKVDCDQEIRRLRERKEERMEGMRSDLEEGMMSDNEQINPRLLDLHKELERLQLENATEWTLREKLETDKLNLEREVKRLKVDLNHVSEEFSKCRLLGSSSLNNEEVTSILQEELNEKNKEMSELRHTQSRLKKQLQEKTSELEHSRSRAEHYEMEVKKLRGRVEQLKRDLANAEDESDQQSISVKKLQRSIEELKSLQSSHQQLSKLREDVAPDDDEVLHKHLDVP